MDTEAAEAFTVSARGGAGLTRRQARHARFIAPSRGVRYAAGTEDPAEATARAALLGSRPDAVLVGVTAAAAWQLPLPPWIGLHLPTHPANVAVAPGGAHPDRRGVRGRRLALPEEHVTSRNGLRLTTPARTWLDCAADIPIEHLIAMGDAALGRRLASPEHLRDLVHWAYRRRGVLSARRALPLLDPRAESPGESLVRAHLLLGRIPAPEVNRDIFDDGEWLARADLCWPRQRVIVEYDGQVHLDERQRRSDARRRNLLQAAGWLVIVFTADDLRQPWQMVGHVRQALTARTPH